MLTALALAVVGCTDQPTNVVHHTGSFRVLPTLTLVVGQRVDLRPQPVDQFDSLLTVSSPAVAFLGMDTITYFGPEGPGVRFQIFHVRGAAAGRSVVTVRFADGTPGFDDSIVVKPDSAHGGFTTVNVGFFLNTCAIGAGNIGHCWGAVADSTDSAHDDLRLFDNTPMPLAGGLQLAAVSLGFDHACALTTAGAAYCWGDNSTGQLGNGTTDSTSSPVAVAGGHTFATISSGSGHTCGVTTAGAIYCWGNDISGQLGNDTMNYVNSEPVLLPDSLNFKAVAAGNGFSCGLTTTGAAYCWGRNDAGELGNGTMTQSLVPVPVAGGLTFVALSTGIFHVCGLTTDGSAYCWGANFVGELGNPPAAVSGSCDVGGSFPCSTTPIPVTGGLKFAKISAGQWATCGVTTGAQGYCWGYNGYGQLGSQSTPLTADPNPTPLPVSGGLSFSTIVTGYYHTCGITTTGAAYCWGDNSWGELGDGSTTFHSTPVPVY